MSSPSQEIPNNEGKYGEVEQEAHFLNNDDQQKSFVVHSIGKCMRCDNFTACKDVTYAESSSNHNVDPHLLCMACWESIPCVTCKQTSSQLVYANKQYLCTKCNQVRLHPPPPPPVPVPILSTPAISIPNPKRDLTAGSGRVPAGTPPDASSMSSPIRSGVVSTPMYTPPASANLGPVMPRTQRITSMNHHEWVRTQEAVNKTQTPSPTTSPAPALGSSPPTGNNNVLVSQLSTSPSSVAASPPTGLASFSLLSVVSPSTSNNNSSNDNNRATVQNSSSSSSTTTTITLSALSGVGPIRVLPLGNLNTSNTANSPPTNNTAASNVPMRTGQTQQQSRFSPQSLKSKKDGEISLEDKARILVAVQSSSRIKPDDDDGEEDYLNISSKISLDGKLDYGRHSLDNSVSEKRGDNSRSELQIVEIDDVADAHEHSTSVYYPEPAN